MLLDLIYLNDNFANMFSPSHNGGDNQETMFKIILKKKTWVKLWSDMKIHCFQKLSEFWKVIKN